MPNTTVPAAAEGLPTDTIVSNRIRELMREISELLDRAGSGRTSFVTIHAAGSGRANHIDLDLIEPTVSSLLLQGVDTQGEAKGYIDLVGHAVEGIEPNQEANALQYVLSAIRKSVDRAQEAVERARMQI